MKYPPRHPQNLPHAHYPEVGDYWSEMSHPVLVVLDVTIPTVVVCETKKDVNRGSQWIWDLDVIHEYTREQFIKKLQYSETNQNFWCDVTSRAHAWAARSLLDTVE